MTRPNAKNAAGPGEDVASPAPRKKVVRRALDRLHVMLETKGVSDEELRQWSSELAVTREALEAERRRYRELFEFAPDGYLVTSLDGTIREANRAAAAMLNVQEFELAGATLVAFVAPEDRSVLLAQLLAVASQSRPESARLEIMLKPRHGPAFPASITVAAARDPEGRGIGLRWLLRDITERKEAEEEIQRLAKFPVQNPHPIMRAMGDGTVVFANEASRPLLEFWGCRAGGRLPHEVSEKVVAALVSGERKDLEIACGDRTFAITLSPIADGGYVNLYGRDIADLKRAEEERRQIEAQLHHAQRLESLGTLTGGIAHDFNNLLTGILGNADLAAEELPAGAPVREYVEEIRRAAVRAAELVSQMLAYSGRGRFLVEPVNLNDLVAEMTQLIEAGIPKNAALCPDFAENLPSIGADAAQVRQVVMSLITNAAEAIGDREGAIIVATGTRNLDRQYLADAYLGRDLPEGPYVYLRVSDTGGGMDAETVPRIFEPFFTTKFAGRGLGLAAVLGVVRGHRGAIKVWSRPGTGSTFEVLFPAGEAPVPASVKVEKPAAPKWQGSGTILVVDDEEGVRKLAARIVAQHGFSVLTAADGKEAVDVFRENAPRIRLVLLDMTMPHMSGEEALREIRRLRPDVKVVLASGYSEQEAMARFADKGLDGFVQKPFEVDTLVRTLRSVLASRAAV